MLIKRSSWPLLLAAVSLALGALLYVLERSNTILLLTWLRLEPLGLEHLGQLGLSLPSFFHSFAFCLVSMWILPSRHHNRPDRRNIWLAFGVWLFVSVGFELGQHHVFASIWHGLGDGGWTRALAHYFLAGTFDVYDVLASVCGCLLALTLYCLRRET